MSADKEHDETPSSPDIHFEPVVSLAKVDTKTFEENEEEMIKLRAKLFRYIIGQHDTTPEWKERGIGDVKILKDKKKQMYRLVMRREKTHKVCANHYLSKEMELKPNCGSDRAWVWSVNADYSDDEPQKETLAIRFANSEFAKKFKEVFDTCKDKVGTEASDVEECDKLASEVEESDKLASELESLKVNGTDETTVKENGVKEQLDEPETVEEQTDETSKETKDEVNEQTVNENGVKEEPSSETQETEKAAEQTGENSKETEATQIESKDETKPETETADTEATPKESEEQ